MLNQIVFCCMQRPAWGGVARSFGTRSETRVLQHRSGQPGMWTAWPCQAPAAVRSRPVRVHPDEIPAREKFKLMQAHSSYIRLCVDALSSHTFLKPSWEECRDSTASEALAQSLNLEAASIPHGLRSHPEKAGSAHENAHEI